MRIPRAAGLTAAALTAVLGLPVPAATAATAATLYVDNTDAQCSDTGIGAQEQPFCTIGAAAEVVKAGGTVHLTGNYQESVVITHSGENGSPITFTGEAWLLAKEGGTDPAVTISGASDVVLRGLTLTSVLVKDSSRITLDRNHAETESATLPFIGITGSSTDVSVTRNRLVSAGHGGIAVGAGATGTTISGNTVASSYGQGITVDSAPNTTITNNTIRYGCGPGVAVTGASTGFNLYNNIIAGHGTTVPDPRGACAADASATEVLVAAEALKDSHSGYNVIWPKTGGTAYSWAGQAQPTQPGQGENDIVADPQFSGFTPRECNPGCSPALDSAKADAPGVLDTDLYGNPIVDDPLAADTGTGSGYRDRGAVELQDTLSPYPTLAVDYAQAPYGTKVTFTATARSNWPSTLSYTYDFGDGTSQTIVGGATTTHTYSAACDCTPKLTVTARGGTQTATAGATIKVTTPGPVVAKLSAAAHLPTSTNPLDHIRPLTVRADAGATVSPWPVTSYTYDFGDGSAPVTQAWSSADHAYKTPGDYKVTVKVTDNQGRTGATSQSFHAAYAPSTYTAVTPFRLLDTRYGFSPVAGGQSRSVDVSNGYPNPDTHKPLTSGSPAAVVLNITATRVTSDTYLTVWPGGQSRPASSNLNVKAGQTVANLVTVPVGSDGAVQIYNHSGNADVIVDFVGLYEPGMGDKFTPTGPSRLLDTRPSAVFTKSEVRSVTVAGKAGVPADASAVVLNLTATGPTANGYLTAYPHGGQTPTVSNLNFTAGQTVANQAIVPIGTDGKIDIYNFAGDTQVIADVFGYFSPGSKGLFTPVIPSRISDTRTSGHPLPAKSEESVQVSGTAGVPADATAAVLNVTATQPTTDGFLTVWPDGSARPTTSNLNFTAGQTVPNHVITPLGSNGKADIYNFVGNTHVFADLFGYFTNG